MAAPIGTRIYRAGHTGASWSSSSFSADPNKLYVVVVVQGMGAGVTPNTPALAGFTGTFTSRGTAGGSDALRITVWTGVGISGTDTLDVSFGGQSQTGGALFIQEYDTADITDPLVQAVVLASGGDASPDMLLGATSDPANSVLSFLVVRKSTSATIAVTAPLSLEGGEVGSGSVIRFNGAEGEGVTTDGAHYTKVGTELWRGMVMEIRASSGTTLSQNVAGSVGIAGAVTTQVGGSAGVQNIAGVVPIAGELVDIAIGLNDGGMEGYVTPVGEVVATIVGEAIELEGEVGIIGELELMALLTFGGNVTPVGSLLVATHLQSAAGSVGIAGAVATLVIGGPAGGTSNPGGTRVDRITGIGSIV